MKRKITLTDPQFEFLTALVKGPQSAVLEWPPARKLVEVGFATSQPESFSRATYTVTEAGLAHLRALYLADRKCGKCKTAPWTCRVCSRKTCEHHCGRKNGKDSTAICGRQSCQEGKPPLVEVEPAQPKLTSLSKGDVIKVGSRRLRVTLVVPNMSKAGGPLIELQLTAKPHTHYTLMEHAREPGRFVLSSVHSAKVIEGWRKAKATHA